MSIAAVVGRLPLAHAALGLCLSTALLACGTADVDADGNGNGAALTSDVPTSPTAVRVALFGEGNKAPANADRMRVWPAWFISEDAGNGESTYALEISGEPVSTRLMAHASGDIYPAADVEFGTPPEASVESSGNGLIAQPMAIVLDVDVDPTTLDLLGELDETTTLGLSNYLAFVPVGGLSERLRKDGYVEGMNILTTEADGTMSKFAFLAVATAGDYFESLDGTADYEIR